jgi:hypothetical protein
MTLERASFILFLLAAMHGLPTASAAATTVYRCTKDGQVVLTDKPCDAPTVSGTAKAPNSAAPKEISAMPTVVGEWKGQTQYQGAENGQLIQDAHSVVLLTLMFTDDGKVSGSSPENGCKVLGVWSPGATSRLFPLDVTLSDCRYAGFNRRYTGQLTATFEKLSGQLFLQAYTLPLPGVPVRRYDVGATLRKREVS